MSAGPDINEVILGSEGTLGVVTEVKMRSRVACALDLISLCPLSIPSVLTKAAGSCAGILFLPESKRPFMPRMAILYHR